MRKTSFAVNEYYHIYNRGVDKRLVFEDRDDIFRFLKIMKEFNREEALGGVHILRGSTSKVGVSRIVNIIAYCLNQNHYHLILEPLISDGIQRFMHRVGTGYTMYFNEKYKRSGALFQGRYKSEHISSNEYLLHLSVYVNLNYRVHKNLNKDWMSVLPFSSMLEYSNPKGKNDMCEKGIILDQFPSIEKYNKYAVETLPDILKRKEDLKMLLE